MFKKKKYGEENKIIRTTFNLSHYLINLVRLKKKKINKFKPIKRCHVHRFLILFQARFIFINNFCLT